MLYSKTSTSFVFDKIDIVEAYPNEIKERQNVLSFEDGFNSQDDGDYLTFKARLSTEAVMPYRYVVRGVDGNRRDVTVREYLPFSELNKEKLIKSAKGAPLVVDHPKGEAVTKHNINSLIQGTVYDVEANEKDKSLDATIRVWGKEAINAIKNKQIYQLSMGYKLQTDTASGITGDTGEPFDLQQKDLELNHIALVKNGRNKDGAKLLFRENHRFEIEGKEWETLMDEVTERRLNSQDKQMEEMTKNMADMKEKHEEVAKNTDEKLEKVINMIDGMGKPPSSERPEKVENDDDMHKKEKVENEGGHYMEKDPDMNKPVEKVGNNADKEKEEMRTNTIADVASTIESRVMDNMRSIQEDRQTALDDINTIFGKSKTISGNTTRDMRLNALKEIGVEEAVLKSEPDRDLKVMLSTYANMAKTNKSRQNSLVGSLPVYTDTSSSSGFGEPIEDNIEY